MGTNYYCHKQDPCPTCGHGGEEYHIGKSSSGWKFLFAPYPEEGLTSKKAWQQFLEGRVITDEYGNTIPSVELFELIESKQKELGSDGQPLRTLRSHGEPNAHRYETLDAEGYRFSTTCDFS